VMQRWRFDSRQDVMNQPSIPLYDRRTAPTAHGRERNSTKLNGRQREPEPELVAGGGQSGKGRDKRDKFLALWRWARVVDVP